jgi:RHS repeat-associated protein
MDMPGRQYSSTNGYRYGFNGQMKSTEIDAGGDHYTAEFWEYDARIGRRWNCDPVFKEDESPYACLSNNPIFNIDPNGDSDSTYKTPGGGSITTETSTAQAFDGGKIKVGNTTVQPAKGTLRSFVATDEGFEGGSARYVATFDTKTGAFKGYGWDKDLTSTYDDYLKAKGEDIVRNIEHANDPMWDPNISHAQGAKNAVNLGLSLIVANPLAGRATNLINKAGAGNTANNTSRVLLNTARQLQAKFKHAIDFGVRGNYSKATAAQFSAALNQHINAARVIQGTYKGQAVIHYLNPTTGVNVITKTTGEFVSGWKLGAGQLQGVLRNGTLW